MMRRSHALLPSLFYYCLLPTAYCLLITAYCLLLSALIDASRSRGI